MALSAEGLFDSLLSHKHLKFKKFILPPFNNVLIEKEIFLIFVGHCLYLKKTSFNC